MIPPLTLNSHYTLWPLRCFKHKHRTLTVYPKYVHSEDSLAIALGAMSIYLCLFIFNTLSYFGADKILLCFSVSKKKCLTNSIGNAAGYWMCLPNFKQQLLSLLFTSFGPVEDIQLWDHWEISITDQVQFAMLLIFTNTDPQRNCCYVSFDKSLNSKYHNGKSLMANTTIPTDYRL